MFVLGEEHQLFRESIRAFLEREVVPFLVDWDRRGEMPAASLYAALGAEGFLGLDCSEKDGGLGLDFTFSVILAEELARLEATGLAMSLMVQTDLCIPALAQYGSDDIKARFLRPAIGGEAIGCLAITEPDAGTDVTALTTSARDAGDHFVVNGAKCFITNGSIASFVLLLCRTGREPGGRGLSLLVVPTSSAGFSAERKYDKLGNRCCDHAELVFHDVVVPRANLLGPAGRGYEIQTEIFVRERLMWGILACGQADNILEHTRRHACQRSIMNRRLIDHQHAAFLLAGLEVEMECLRQLIASCLPLLLAGHSCVRETARIKLKASRVLRQVADECLQLFGGAGYMNDLPVTRAFRDGRAAALAGGTAEAMLHLLAQWLQDAKGDEDEDRKPLR